jgi:hypothetical protein
MSEPTKTITAMQLTDALTQHFIDANMGMPGPRQERMAADVWFRLPVPPTVEPDLSRASLEALLTRAEEMIGSAPSLRQTEMHRHVSAALDAVRVFAVNALAGGDVQRYLSATDSKTLERG